MTDWTPKDTEALADLVRGKCYQCVCEEGTGLASLMPHACDEFLEARAAEHIEELEARVAELQRDLLAKLMEPVPMLRLDDGMAQLLRARECIVTLEAERANAIPRAALVSALRRRCSSCGGNRYVHGYDGSEEGYQEECPGCHHSDAYDIADEIERGEWPQATEGETK